MERYACRGVRGAIAVRENGAEAILAATRRLLQEIVSSNGIATEDIASIFFTLTPDLDATFPALAARQLGWLDVPLLCAREVAAPGAHAGIVRVLLHWNTTQPQDAIRHVYTGGAEALRPDLVRGEGL